MEIQLLAANAIPHHMNRQLRCAKNRVGNLINQLAGLLNGFSRMLEQVFFNIVNRLGGVDKSVFNPRRCFPLQFDLFYQRPLGSKSRVFLSLKRRFFLDGSFLHLARLRLGIAACRIVTNLGQAERLDNLDLLFVFYLEVIKGEGMLKPLQIKVDV